MSSRQNRSARVASARLIGDPGPVRAHHLRRNFSADQ
jgi:hypothetical protein